MNLLIIVHADFAIPTYIQDWAMEKNVQLNFSCPANGDLLPHLSLFDCLIILGGNYSLLEEERPQFLRNEIKLVEEAIASEKIILGICLGAQILGEAFGIQTEKSPNKEVGVFPIELTDDGKTDPLIKGFPNVFSGVHWHNNMPGITPKSKILAFSEGCPRQIIRYSNKAYAFQWHPEVTLEDVQKACLYCKKDLYPGPYIQSEENLLESDFVEMNNRMIAILNNLLSL